MCVAVLSRFLAVPGSDLIVGAEDSEVLQTMTSDLTTCVQGNARTQTHRASGPDEVMGSSPAASDTRVFNLLTAVTDTERKIYKGSKCKSKT